MASKDSVRFLAQSIGGLGDRLRQSAQDQMANTRADVGLSLQNRYAGLAEGRANEEMKSRRKAEAKQRFVEAMTLLAAPIARANKSDNPSLFFDQVAPAAYKTLSPEDQAAVGMEQFKPKPSEVRFKPSDVTGAIGTPYPPTMAQRVVGGVTKPFTDPIGAVMDLRKRLSGR